MAKRFDRQLDKATDTSLVDPNWDAIIECVDMIRAGDVPVKVAIASIKKRYHNENPHIAHHALLVLEACMKNCGAKFHAEVATKEFMEDLKNLSLDSTPDKVKNKILELLQCWTMAFKNKPEYKIVVDTHNLMKLAGFDFPQVAEADAMFIAQSAPEWADGEECYRCRTVFGLITRKHHCRACGQIFCDKCSSKQSFLPQYGIERQVRVCEGCYEKTASKEASEITSTAGSGQSGQKDDKSQLADTKIAAEKREQELKQAEEDEINLAIALSQSEAEAQEQERQRRLYQMYNGASLVTSAAKTSAPQGDAAPAEFVYRGAASANGDDVDQSKDAHVDLELARYLNRDYWQQRKKDQRFAATQSAGTVFNGEERRITPTPTAPPPSDSSRSHSQGGGPNFEPELTHLLRAMSVASTTKQLDGGATPTPQFLSTEEEETAETMEFCRQLREQVTVMDNRIRSNVARNRSVVNDSAIQSLFIRLTEMHAQVMVRMNKLEDQRNYFESLQDKLAHIQEARQAIDSLREDYERQKRERALEEQKLKQMQMQQKVDLMRQKKHEMILHQRHMALLRFQQQEQEMHMKRMQVNQGAPQVGYAQMPYVTVSTTASPPVDPAYTINGANYGYATQSAGFVDQANTNCLPVLQQYPNAAVPFTDSVAAPHHQYANYVQPASSQYIVPECGIVNPAVMSQYQTRPEPHVAAPLGIQCSQANIGETSTTAVMFPHPQQFAYVGNDYYGMVRAGEQQAQEMVSAQPTAFSQSGPTIVVQPDQSFYVSGHPAAQLITQVHAPPGLVAQAQYMMGQQSNAQTAAVPQSHLPNTEFAEEQLISFD